MAPRTTRATAARLGETAIPSKGKNSDEGHLRTNGQLAEHQSSVKKPSPASTRKLRRERSLSNSDRTTAGVKSSGNDQAASTKASRSAPKVSNNKALEEVLKGTAADAASDVNEKSETESFDCPPRKKRRAKESSGSRPLRDSVSNQKEDSPEELPRFSKALRRTKEADIDLYTPSAAERMLLQKDDERILRELSDNSEDEKPTMMFGYFL